MEGGSILDAPGARLVLHDVAHCRALCQETLDSGVALPAAARNELVICVAACEMALERLRAGAPDVLHALEFCESAARRCVDGLAGLAGHGGVEICARMADLCSDSLQRLLYDPLD